MHSDLIKKRYSLDDIMGCKPCYKVEMIKEWMGDKDQLSILDIASCEKVPETYDKLWIITRLLYNEKSVNELIHLLRIEKKADSFEDILNTFLSTYEGKR